MYCINENSCLKDEVAEIIAAGIGAHRPSPELCSLSPQETVVESSKFYIDHQAIEQDMVKFDDSEFQSIQSDTMEEVLQKN